MFTESFGGDDPISSAISRARAAFGLRNSYQKKAFLLPALPVVHPDCLHYLTDLLPETEYRLGDITIGSANDLDAQINRGKGLGLERYDLIDIASSDMAERYFLDAATGRVMYFEMHRLGSYIHQVLEIEPGGRKDYLTGRAGYIFNSLEHFFLYVEDIALNPEDEE